MDKRSRPVKRRGQYSYQRQMAAHEDAAGALLEWIGRGLLRLWDRVRGR